MAEHFCLCGHNYKVHDHGGRCLYMACGCGRYERRPPNIASPSVNGEKGSLTREASAGASETPPHTEKING